MSFQKAFLLFSVLAILVIASGCSPNEEANSAPEWRTVSHKQFNFSIEYPAKWRISLHDENGWKGIREARIVLLLPFYLRGSSSNFRILIESRTAVNPTLQDVVAWGDEYLDAIYLDPVTKINTGLEEIFLQEDEINGIPILRRRYAFRKSGLMFEEVYIARNQDMFMITMSTNIERFDDFYEDFNHVVNSFRPLIENGH